MRDLNGIVERIEDHTVYVACKRAPRYLQTVSLRLGHDCPPDIQVGDRMVLTYIKSPSMAIWIGMRK